MESLVIFQPAFYLRVLMRGVVVTDNVNLFILGRRLIYLAKKVQPFLMAMPLGAGTQHFPCQGIQCSKLGRGAITLIVMCHCRRPAFFHR